MHTLQMHLSVCREEEEFETLKEQPLLITRKWTHTYHFSEFSEEGNWNAAASGTASASGHIYPSIKEGGF